MRPPFATARRYPTASSISVYVWRCPFCEGRNAYVPGEDSPDPQCYGCREHVRVRVTPERPQRPFPFYAVRRFKP